MTRQSPEPALEPVTRHFASDNYSGVHPAVLDAIAAANAGHVPSYGEDPVTVRLRDVVKERWGPQAEVYPVFNGTAANVVSLTAITPRWGSVIVTSSAHTLIDEGGAPEHVSGLKLEAADTSDGKLTPEMVAPRVRGIGNVHRSQPAALSIAQTTELGTVYSPAEVAALCEAAHARGLLVHLDGARIWNAAAALGVAPEAFTSEAGVDIFSLGATKNGALAAEAIVVLNPLIEGLPYLRKYLMQLPSKSRFVSAQLVALLDDDLGVRIAAQANAMATRLRGQVEGLIEGGRLPGVRFTQDSPANTVLVELPAGAADRLRQRYRFHDWSEDGSEVRWMCSFDTTEADVDAFVRALEEAVTGR